MGSARSLGGNARRDPQQFETALVEDAGALYGRPLDYVLYAYPWGTGELEGFKGPDTWQRGFLLEWEQEIALRKFDGRTPVDPQMFSTVSGHGVGKSAVVGWVCDFIPVTRPFCRGRVTANTSPQLNSTTWAEIAKWSRRSIFGHWFKVTSGRGSMRKFHRTYPDEWFVNGLAWNENEPDAFAGQHAPTSTSFYVFDEASGVARSIVETAKGGMTDGEPMLFMFGNGTRNSGPFFDTHHEAREKKQFKRFHVDARQSGIANHRLHETWIEQYTIDSDFVRVRVLGQFPKQSAAQFVPTDYVEMARKRQVVAGPTEPLILGVDVARMGDDDTRFVYRRGRDARSIKSIRHSKMDTVQVADAIDAEITLREPDAIIIDIGGLGVGVYDTLMHRKRPNVHGVNFGTKMAREYVYMNGWMMGRLRDWLRDGGAIEDDDALQEELIGREYWLMPDGRTMLEPKELLKDRIGRSPDHADALSLTFAVDIGPRELSTTRRELAGSARRNGWDYNPLEGA